MRLITNRRRVLQALSACATLTKNEWCQGTGQFTKSPSILCVRDFGAYGDGNSDDTTAMQKAHATGKIIYYPSGIYKFKKIQMNSGGIIGDGLTSQLTSFDCEDNLPAITYTPVASDYSHSPVFEKFSLIGPPCGYPTATGIIIKESGNKPQITGFPIFRDLHLRHLGRGISLNNCIGARIESCSFFLYSSAAIEMANSLLPDAGDSHVTGCHFYTSHKVASIAIHQVSAGGLRITNNKFNGGAIGYKLDLEATTSDLIFSANSAENLSEVAVLLRNQTNRSTHPIRFRNIIINGNQFSDNQRDIRFDNITEGANVSYWDGIAVTGNTFYRTSAEKSITLSSARGYLIRNNVFMSRFGSDNLIQIDTNCASGNIGENGIYIL